MKIIGAKAPATPVPSLQHQAPVSGYHALMHFGMGERAGRGRCLQASPLHATNQFLRYNIGNVWAILSICPILRRQKLPLRGLEQNTPYAYAFWTHHSLCYIISVYDDASDVINSLTSIFEKYPTLFFVFVLYLSVYQFVQSEYTTILSHFVSSFLYFETDFTHLA